MKYQNIDSLQSARCVCKNTCQKLLVFLIFLILFGDFCYLALMYNPWSSNYRPLYIGVSLLVFDVILACIYRRYCITEPIVEREQYILNSENTSVTSY